jgi:hypothetical protein
MLLTIINVPIRAQIVNLDSAIKSGILLLPLMGGTAVGSAIGGSASSRKNNTFWTLSLASIFMLVGTALLSTLPGSLEPVAKQWGFETILGLGLGLSLSSMTLLTSVQVNLQDHGAWTSKTSSHISQLTPKLSSCCTRACCPATNLRR